MVFAFGQQVLRINASAFKGHRLDFIHVECVDGKRLTTSTPDTLGFIHWSLVTLMLSRMVDNTVTFFLPLFFLLM